MNVLLINPPSTNIIRESLPPVVEDDTGVYPPLGLLYVAAYAEDVPGCKLKVLDCQAEGIMHENIGERLLEFKPDVIGIQVMTFTLIDAVMAARTAREVSPDAFIVFGGPHATIFPHETIMLPEVDAVVIGEGEYPFASLLEAIQERKPIEPISGILTKQSYLTEQSTTKLRYIEDLDRLKMPAYHFLDLSLYFSPMATHRKVITMMSSRGCPYQCIFCDRPQMGKTFRKRSAENVFQEMLYCVQELRIGEIIFYDDTFTVDKQRVIELCDLIIASKLRVLWDIRARVDTMTNQMINKLSRAGCVRIHYGVETGSQRLQKVLRKNLDLKKVREVFLQTHRKGIETLGYFMIGIPTETEAEQKETLDLMTSLPMDYAHIGIFTPYPGTEIYREALKRGFYTHDYWREFALSPNVDFTPKYWNELCSDEELLVLLKKAYVRFYRRPGYLLHRLLKVRSPLELLQKATLGFKLLREVSKQSS